MAIKLNNADITSNKLNFVEITDEKLNGSKVYPVIVYASAWAPTTNTNVSQLYEYTAFLISQDYEGCNSTSNHIANLPSPTGFVVGTIVGIKCNSTRSGTCDTWAYFEAIKSYKWVFITYHSSEPDTYDYYLTGNYAGNTSAMITAIGSQYSAGQYNLGYIAVIAEQSDGNFYEFECQAV